MIKRNRNHEGSSRLISRKSFVSGLVSTCVLYATGCEREDVLSGISQRTLPQQFGTGDDGEIIIPSGPVNIADGYENDIVSGVITARGVNRGLNHKGIEPADNYDPLSGRCINAENFTVRGTAVLTCVPYNGQGGAGIVAIRCTGSCSIEVGGSIDVSGKGYQGGAGGVGPLADGKNGSGPGGGHYGNNAPINDYGTGGFGGTSYGAIDMGSGGGGGGSKTGELDVANGGDGGNGGGLVMIYARNLVVGGRITATGLQGVKGFRGEGVSGGGGGSGSGGCIYVETYSGADLGSYYVTARGGDGIICSHSGNAGGGGGGGSYTTVGATGASGSDGVQQGGNGLIVIVGDYFGDTDPAPRSR